jgi:hypothetical protein
LRAEQVLVCQIERVLETLACTKVSRRKVEGACGRMAFFARFDACVCLEADARMCGECFIASLADSGNHILLDDDPHFPRDNLLG